MLDHLSLNNEAGSLLRCPSIARSKQTPDQGGLGISRGGWALHDGQFPEMAAMTNTRKILIVDDDAELRDAMVEQLALRSLTPKPSPRRARGSLPASTRSPLASSTACSPKNYRPSGYGKVFALLGDTLQ